MPKHKQKAINENAQLTQQGKQPLETKMATT